MSYDPANPFDRAMLDAAWNEMVQDLRARGEDPDMLIAEANGNVRALDSGDLLARAMDPKAAARFVSALPIDFVDDLVIA